MSPTGSPSCRRAAGRAREAVSGACDCGCLDAPTLLDVQGFIRRVRRRADLSQRGLAAVLGVDQSLVARWETPTACWLAPHCDDGRACACEPSRGAARWQQMVCWAEA
ncbi:XRE family transcriptional regulator [Propioniciclava sinopodophylli]|uniref:XRE family transcriptional regulator n=1 Tax=Propioniciclava sinopodophylli TaxID=1837344 RepID=A0A4Q9KF20_9ACTN|nr:XRE family transcriptional regulator [Propioniciclava sinopodophylli]